MRIIIDTNLWVSYLISKRMSGLRQLCLDENISVFYCEKLVEDFLRVSNRPKIRKLGIKEQRILAVSEFIRLNCIKAEIKIMAEYIIRDPDDAYLLALAEATNSDFILTGDKDLWVLEEYNEIKIISFSKFIQRYY